MITGWKVIQNLVKGESRRQIALKYTLQRPHQIQRLGYGSSYATTVDAHWLSESGWVPYAHFELQGNPAPIQLAQVAYETLKRNENGFIPDSIPIRAPHVGDFFILEEGRIGEVTEDPNAPKCCMCGRSIDAEPWQGQPWGSEKRALYCPGCW